MLPVLSDSLMYLSRSKLSAAGPGPGRPGPRPNDSDASLKVKSTNNLESLPIIPTILPLALLWRLS